jgi:Immunity protein 53
MTSSPDPLQGLQEWYAAQCDGGREHQYGVTIKTIDNPGWRLAVDLSFTDVADRPFTDVEVTADKDKDWYVCRAKDQVFEGICSPNRLADVISIFLAWARAPAHS